MERGGVDFYVFKSFTSMEEHETVGRLRLQGGNQTLKGKAIDDAQRAITQLGWDIKGVSHGKADGVTLTIDSTKALNKIIAQMEEAEVGMGNVYKE